MNKINWAQKLSSRKFWAVVTAVVISVLAFFNIGDELVGQITVFIAAVGSLAIYIIGESYVDANRENDPPKE